MSSILKYACNQQFTCYTYFLNTNNARKAIMYTKDSGHLLLKFTFNVSSLLDADLYYVVHHATTFPDDLKIVSRQTVLINLSVTVQVSVVNYFNLLPPPFVTNCRKVLFAEHSRQACINRCTSKQSSAKLKIYFPSIMKKCYAVCSQPDCERYEYKLDIISYVDSDETILNIIRRSARIQYSYELKEAIILVDLLFYVSSSISLWFGISLLTIGTTLSEFATSAAQYLISQFSTRLTRRTTRYVLLAICSVICLYEINDIIVEYKRYVTITDFAEMRKPIDEFPAFTIYELSNFKTPRYNSSMFSESLFRNRFKRCSFVNETTREEVENCGNITVSFMNGYILHTFLRRSYASNRNKYRYQVAAVAKTVITLLFNGSETREFLFAFHSFGSTKSILSSFAHDLTVNKRYNIHLAFRLITINSLPEPCPSFCQCYRRIGYDFTLRAQQKS